MSNKPEVDSVSLKIGAVSDAIDEHLANNEGRIDLGEMAQMAASETITKVIGHHTQSLFGTTSEDVKRAFSKFATNRQFSKFARDFFSRLTLLFQWTLHQNHTATIRQDFFFEDGTTGHSSRNLAKIGSIAVFLPL